MASGGRSGKMASLRKIRIVLASAPRESLPESSRAPRSNPRRHWRVFRVFSILLISLCGSGCTLLSSIQPDPPKSNWAEDRDGNVSRNSTESSKFAGFVTDDSSGNSAPSALKERPAETPTSKTPLAVNEQPAGTPPGQAPAAAKAQAPATLRGTKQIPLSL